MLTNFRNRGSLVLTFSRLLVFSMTKVLLLLAISIPLPAQPNLSAFTCRANGPNSILCAWTTDTAADSKVTAIREAGCTHASRPPVRCWCRLGGYGAQHGDHRTTERHQSHGLLSDLDKLYCKWMHYQFFGYFRNNGGATHQYFSPGSGWPVDAPNDQFDGGNGSPNTQYAQERGTRNFYLGGRRE